MTLLEVADDLYGLPLDQFTQSRNTRAKEADGPVAGQIRALRKPSAAAWVVNQLVRRHRTEVQSLLELGQSLRDAQDELDRDTLTSLGQQRRKVVAALARRATDVAIAHGQAVAPATVTEVEQTLQAAMTDPLAGDALRTGRLLRGLTVSGFEPVDLTDAVAADAGTLPDGTAPDGTGRSEASGTTTSRTARPSRQERREQELAEATAKATETADWAREAENALAGIDRARAAVDARRHGVEQSAERLRRELAVLDEELATADAESRDLDRERESAARTARSARRSAERARERMEALG